MEVLKSIIVWGNGKVRTCLTGIQFYLQLLELLHNKYPPSSRDFYPL